ncbi:sulfonate transport system permease protein [Paramicrobacterium humi]|uniref:Sulfonate transport system permease protein n=1 Tax=Paramicrobacterium humi TaxID=640635 RepID=A0A1H4M866_9MICO|nr:ABC transporter permease [Microbacterium humi]SEB79007.1 sulfonate transport system permease protein [Microbacterium humi]
MSTLLTPERAAGERPAALRGERLRAVLGRRWFVIVGGLVIPVIALTVWQLVSALELFPVSQLPSPAMVWNSLLDMAERGWLAQDVAISAQRVIIGFLIGAALGLLLGAIVGLSRLGDILLAPTLGAIRAVPSLAWIPLLMIWLKIGEDSKITLVAIGAFFPVYTTVASALRHVDRQLVEAARAFGHTGLKLFTTVQLPAIIPSVVSGLRLALAQAWLFLVAAELIASSMGLGFRLIDSQNNGRVDRIFLLIIILAVLGKATDALIGVFERQVQKRLG